MRRIWTKREGITREGDKGVSNELIYFCMKEYRPAEDRP